MSADDSTSTKSDDPTSTGRLSRDALVYGLGFVAQRAVSFIMLPIYTRYLSTSDYATVHLLVMSVDVAAIFLSAGVTAGVFRFYFKTDDERTARGVVVAAWTMMQAFHLVGALALYLGSDVIAGLVLKDPGQGYLVALTALSFVLDPCLTLPTLLMQVRQRSGLYTGVSIAKLVLQLALNVLFVVVLEEGVRGILLSTIITYAVLTPFLLAWFFRRTGFPIIKAVYFDLIRFGLPYRVTTAGTFILTYADRYFLVAWHDLDVTGVYSLAYQFGFVLAHLTEAPFFLAWNPQRFRLVREDKEVREKAYNRGLLLFSCLVMLVVVGISLFVTPTLHIMSNPEYHGAAVLVPVILAAYAFQGWTKVYEFGIQVSERTSRATIATWIAVVTALIGYALLVPPFGAWGAALATVVAFALRLAAFVWFAQRLWPVAYDWWPTLRLAGYAAAIIAAYFVWSPEGFWAQVGVATVFTGVFFALMWRGGVLGVAERDAIVRMIRTRLHQIGSVVANRSRA
ncbi:MAG: lipopolysaccharide biosynthesis protein [Myxococcota bacterium]